MPRQDAGAAGWGRADFALPSGGTAQSGGAFTPTVTVTGGGSAVLSAASVGQWLKLGNLRWATMTLVLSSVSGLGAGSQFSFGGLPTPTFGPPTNRIAIAVIGEQMGASAGQMVSRINAGDSNLLFRVFRLTGGVLTAPGNSYIIGGTQMTLTATWVE